MKKIWLYIALILFGFILGAIFWEHTSISTKYETYIETVKQKGRDNKQDVVFKPELGTTQSKKDQRKAKRESRQDERKERKADK